MSFPHWLDAASTQQLFEHPVPSEPLALVRPKKAKVLWLNRGAMLEDPVFFSLGNDPARYEQHLILRCAYQLSDEAANQSSGHAHPGYADRYGGIGIGLNGGSGRAAFVGGYHVKGVGRTPLISAHTERAHASGGAYLEESVRDIIFTEIVRAEFPHSAVPILALIDTGETQTFEFPTHTDIERRVLVVRPPFVRPAHYLRSYFVSDDPKEGARDAKRVQRNFAITRELRGAGEFARDYEGFHERWARQMAYGFIHRLPHGSHTPSNICFDGRLLDFGAMSAMPSWANTAVMLARQPFAAYLHALPRLVRDSSYFFGRHLDPRLSSKASEEKLTKQARLAFRHVSIVETLRLFGVERHDAEDLSMGSEGNAWWQRLLTLIAHFEREFLDMMKSTPRPRIPWDLGDVWSACPPAHLVPLQEVLKSTVAIADRAACEQRCRSVTRTREGLFRHDARRALFSALEQGPSAAEPNRETVERQIDRLVAANRRDSRHLPRGTVPFGFAVSSGRSLVLCKNVSTGGVQAVDEVPGQSGECHPVARYDGHAVHFFASERPSFLGAVCAAT